MTEDNIILRHKFDEPNGSGLVYDYTAKRQDGVAIESQFVPGPSGNCIKFDGTGYVHVTATEQINLAGNFSLWIKVKPDTSGPFSLKLAHGASGITDINFGTVPADWTELMVIKSGNTVATWINQTQMNIATISGVLKSYEIRQDNDSGDFFRGQVDDFRMYKVAINPLRVIGSQPIRNKVRYFINYVNLADWGIVVSDSDGVLDRPAMKEPFTMDWPEYHGTVPDLRKKRLQPREIDLSCWMKASSELEFKNRINSFLSVFGNSGTQRLHIEIADAKPLVYEVYNQEGVSIKKKWRSDLMIGTFSLKLIEPVPVKRVITTIKEGSAGSTVSVTLTCPRILTIHWGDGTKTDNVFGTGITVSHTYTVDGIYHAIIAGNIEDITSFSTTGIIAWSKL